MHRLRLNPAKSSGKPECCSIPFVFDQMTAWGCSDVQQAYSFSPDSSGGALA